MRFFGFLIATFNASCTVQKASKLRIIVVAVHHTQLSLESTKPCVQHAIKRPSLTWEQ